MTPFAQRKVSAQNMCFSWTLLGILLGIRPLALFIGGLRNLKGHREDRVIYWKERGLLESEPN